MWTEIPGFPDYDACREGLIRSRKKGGFRLLSLKKTDPAGYPQLGLFVDGKRKYVRLHSLIARTFLGDPPPGLEPRHLDGVKTNCHVGNLEYGTRQQNILDLVTHGNHVNARKTECIRRHPFSGPGSDSYVDGRGQRVCRHCTRDRRIGLDKA